MHRQWRSRTIALQLDREDTILFSCLVNAQGKYYNMNLPSGYYGNALAFPIVCSKAEILCKSLLGYGVELVKKPKDKMSEEYKSSFGDDLMLIKRRRIMYLNKGDFIVSNLSKAGFDHKIDLGRGKLIFAGIAGAIYMLIVFAKYQKQEEESRILIPIHLLLSNMKRFEEVVKRMIQGSMKDLFDIEGTLISYKLFLYKLSNSTI